MDRRWVGFFIVFAVLGTAIVVPDLGTRRLAGRPVAAPIPGPPSVGDCLMGSTIVTWLNNPNPLYSSPRLAPCTGLRYGEVVAVMKDSRTPAQVAAASLATQPHVTVGPDPNLLACNAALGPYLGLSSGRRSDGVDEGVDEGGGWSSAGSVIPAPAGPDDRQKAAGQHWVACLATNVDPDRLTRNASVNALEYPGSARQVYSMGRPPSVFAVCVPKMILPAILWPVRCSRAHTVEIFGVTETHSKYVTQSQLDATCVGMVRRLTRIPDPTVGGRLTLTAAGMHLDANGEGQLGLSTAKGEGGFAICLAVAPETHRLKGALLGLGTGPVPWA